jgi:hypothetical protein
MKKKPLRGTTWNAAWDLDLPHAKLQNHLNRFERSKNIGLAGEKFVANILSNKRLRVEVKTDLRCSTSNNLAIEIQSRNKPSGLSTTKSDVWAFVVGKGAIIFVPVYVLKKICQKLMRESTYYLRNVGDRDKEGKPTSKIVLLPISKLVKLVEEFS